VATIVNFQLSFDGFLRHGFLPHRPRATPLSSKGDANPPSLSDGSLFATAPKNASCLVVQDSGAPPCPICKFTFFLPFLHGHRERWPGQTVDGLVGWIGRNGTRPSEPCHGGTACHVRFSTLDNPFQFTRVSVGAIHELPLQRRRDPPVEPPLGGTCLSRPLRDVGLSSVIHRARQACPSEGFRTGTRLSGPMNNG